MCKIRRMSIAEVDQSEELQLEEIKLYDKNGLRHRCIFPINFPYKINTRAEESIASLRYYNPLNDWHLYINPGFVNLDKNKQELIVKHLLQLPLEAGKKPIINVEDSISQDEMDNVVKLISDIIASHGNNIFNNQGN